MTPTCIDNQPHLFQALGGNCTKCGAVWGAPVEPSPYEQGFRDALITARALLAAPDATCNMWGEDETLAEKRLGALIDQKNHDLWQLFAVARADLSAYPEAQTLRSMLRAPSGVLIDGDGRMLFLRLNGTEYDTGVLGLLEECKLLRTAVAEHMAEIKCEGSSIPMEVETGEGNGGRS